jgi:hypothetical protein
MAIYMVNAKADLVAKIKQAIKDKKIETWECDEDGDFTYNTSDKQWYKKAWLRPKTINGQQVFGIMFPKEAKVTSIVYAIYHGRFIEMLLAHFDSDFTKAESTATLIANVDIYTPSP